MRRTPATTWISAAEESMDPKKDMWLGIWMTWITTFQNVSFALSLIILFPIARSFLHRDAMPGADLWQCTYPPGGAIRKASLVSSPHKCLVVLLMLAHGPRAPIYIHNPTLT